MMLGGIDIGGTKCAAVIGIIEGDSVSVVDKVRFPTEGSPADIVQRLATELDRLVRKQGGTGRLEAVGISCGGPLDSRKGLVLSPPNLPDWDGIDVCGPFRERFGVPVGLQNDANACALAEWKWGAGRGTENMIFLTFGTGMGAGLILNGRLYAGTNDMAGEVGHMRLEEDGPVGYGKAGSFEGFCSGGGIAQLARAAALRSIERGEYPSFCPDRDALFGITTQKVGEAAQAGDPLALDIFRQVAVRLGRGLAVLVDILNPERIVIGSIYGRQRSILEPLVLEELRKEALPHSIDVCEIVPAGLDDSVGDLASLSVALNVLD